VSPLSILPDVLRRSHGAGASAGNLLMALSVSMHAAWRKARSDDRRWRGVLVALGPVQMTWNGPHYPVSGTGWRRHQYVIPKAQPAEQPTGGCPRTVPHG